MVTKTSTGRSVGDAVRLNFSLTSTGGSATDSDVTLIVEPPAGEPLVLTSTSTATASTSLPSTNVVHLATGSYYADVLSTGPGRYAYHWRSTGTIHASTDGAWAVRPAAASS